MSIATEITKLDTNLTASYTACQNKGATMPTDQNFDNLATCINSISGGGGGSPVITSLNVTPTTSAQTITAPQGTDGYSPVNVSAVTSAIDQNITQSNIKSGVTILGVTGNYTGSATLITKNITQNGTYNASDDSADGYSSVTVNGSGGGGDIGIPREVSAQGVYQIPASSFTFSLPSTAIDVGNSAMYYAFQNCTSLTSADLSSLTTISGSQAMYNAFHGCTGLTSLDLSSLTTISSNAAMYSAFYGCTGLTSLDLSSLTTIRSNTAMYSAFYDCTGLTSLDLSSLTTVIGNTTMQYAFQNCTGLTSVNFANLQTIGINTSSTNYGQFSYCFNNFNNLTSITFPKLEKIYCTGGTSTGYGTFANNNKVQKMYFPKLDTITYGRSASSTNQNACKNVFYGCSELTELHFAAANQAAIQSSLGYSTAWGRGAGNVTIYFDL